MDALRYRQLRAFATQDGTFLGALWIASAACFVGQFSHPLLSMLSMALGVFSVGFAFIRVKRFGRKIWESDFTFGQAWLYSTIMIICASVLMAIITYVYFAFLDHGYVFNEYSTIIGAPETKKMLKMSGIDTATIDLMMKQMAETTPIDWAMNMLSSNIMLGMILSPFLALYGKRKS